MAQKRKKPPIEDVLDIISYDPQTGSVTYKVSISRSKQKGDDASKVSSNGYLRIDVLSHNFVVHRLAFLFMTGEMPPSHLDVDHIDHNRKNNSWSNLRLVSRSENCKNLSLTDKNQSGCIGVTWNKNNNNWRARIRVDGDYINLGSFAKYSEAVNARKNAEALYGFHVNHGT